MSDGVEHVGSWIAAIIAAITGVFVTLKGLARVIRRTQHFLDDWFGEEARDGVPARPGVMERLEAMEAALVTATGRLDGLEGDVGPRPSPAAGHQG